MDRISALGYVLNAAGKRVFANENLAAGVDGTDVDQGWLTGVQEEVVGAIEASGQVLNVNDNTQLTQAIPLLVHGAMISRQWFNTVGAGQYNRSSPGVKLLRVYVQAGGGASAGSPATSANQVSAGGAGGGGAYAELAIVNPPATIALSIGNGGQAQVGGNGFAGGDSSFGTVDVAGGMPGATAGPSSQTTFYAAGGNGGARPAAGINPVSGNSGQGTQINVGQGSIGLGGSGLIPGHGAGAYGTSNSNSQPAIAGVNGQPGVIVVEEYS